jgi:acylphosphatase
MKPSPLLAVLALAFLHPPAAPSAAKDDLSAVAGLVSGNVQKVGFRAMILKAAIRYNLAGTAKNNADKTVAFILQGDPARIKAALKVIAKGTKKSSDVKVKTTKAKVDPKLKTFIVIGWTSTSRNITTPYDLKFTTRKDNKEVDEKEAKKAYHQILMDTLKGEDLKKAFDK